MPMTANIIQTAKQTVNAIVLMIATDHCWVLTLGPGRLAIAVVAVIGCSPERA